MTVDYQVIPYEPNHARNMAIDADYIGLIEDNLDTFKDGGVGITIMADGVPIACTGLMTLWEGVVEGWFLASADLDGHGLPVLSICRDYMNEAQMKSGIRRIQAVVDINNWKATRFVEFLGMEYEGDMPGYGVCGETYKRYARVMR